MPHIFHIHRESVKRRYAVYVVIAKSDSNVDLYVGKVGDNREGCNPLISRCGNHFSYNEVHSQIRNKIIGHEVRDYTYVFEHFDEYSENSDVRRAYIDRINEMERWLNQKIQQRISGNSHYTLVNPYRGVGYISSLERKKREGFRTKESEIKIDLIVSTVVEICS